MTELESAQLELSKPVVRCAFCGHDNPAGSNYCNECAADLRLTLCPACDAINERGTLQCHKCSGSLVATRLDSVASPAGALQASLPAPDPAPTPRRSRVALLLVAGAAIAAAGYAAYRTGYLPMALKTPVPVVVQAGPAAEPEALPAADPSSGPVASAPPQPQPPEVSTEPFPQVPSPPRSVDVTVDRPQPGCTDAVAALALCTRNGDVERK